MACFEPTYMNDNRSLMSLDCDSCTGEVFFASLPRQYILGRAFVCKLHAFWAVITSVMKHVDING